MIGTAGDFTMEDDGHWSGPDPAMVKALELAYPSDSPLWLADRPRPLQALCTAAKDNNWPLVVSRPLEPLPEDAVS